MSKQDAEQLQEIGMSAFEAIAEMVAALEVDYDRLETLRSLQNDHWDDTEATEQAELQQELTELEEAAGECKDREDAERFIHEDPLSLQVRSGWHDIGENTEPEEFEILLGTGGPATRIIGELSSGEPTRARLQAQDWGTPWTDYVGADQDTLLTYCRCFYFGEG